MRGDEMGWRDRLKINDKPQSGWRERLDNSIAKEKGYVKDKYDKPIGPVISQNKPQPKQESVIDKVKNFVFLDKNEKSTINKSLSNAANSPIAKAGLKTLELADRPSQAVKGALVENQNVKQGDFIGTAKALVSGAKKGITGEKTYAAKDALQYGKTDLYKKLPDIGKGAIDFLAEATIDPTNLTPAGLVKGATKGITKGLAKGAIKKTATENTVDLAKSLLKNQTKTKPIRDFGEAMVGDAKALPPPSKLLQLEAPKLRTPDVIYGMPPKPTTKTFKTAENYLKPQAKQEATIKDYASTLKDFRDVFIKEYMEPGAGNGVNQGNLNRTLAGDVVGRNGRTSNNDIWYQEYFKETGKLWSKTSKADKEKLADKFLKEGMPTSGGFMPPDKSYLKLIDELEKQRNPAKSNISQANKGKLYREVGVDRLESYFDKSLFDSPYGTISEINVAKTPEMAIGQGSNKGIKLEFSDKNIPLKKVDKPFNPDNGEFIVDSGSRDVRNYQDYLRSNLEKITIDKGLIGNITKEELENSRKFAIDKARFNNFTLNKIRQKGWKETVDEQGNIVFTNPVLLNKPQVNYTLMPNTAKKVYDEAQRNVSYNVDPQFKRETPFTVARSSVPPKVQPQYSREIFGNKLPLPQLKQATSTIKAEGIDSARSKINYTPSKKTSNISEKIDSIRTAFVDKLRPLEKLETDVKGKIGDAKSSIYKQGRLFAGVPERANVIIDTELKPIIQKIEAKGYNAKDLGLYAEAVHAKDVNAAELKSGFTDAEIDDVISKLGNADMEEARKALVNYSDKRLQHLVENQVVSQEAYDAMKSKWQNYIPLNRAFDDDKVEFVGALGETFANVASPIKALKGSDRQIIDPIESLIKNTYRSENAAGRNKVGLQLSELAKTDKGAQQIRQLSEQESVGRMNVVNIKESGQNVKYEVEPEVYKAMLNMNAESSPTWVKIMSKPASVLRAGATLTPEFALRNPIRDTLSAFVNSKSGFTPFVDTAKGVVSYAKKDQLYQDFLKANGGYGNILSMDRQAHREALKSLSTPTMKDKFVNIVNPKSWLNLMRTISEATETGTKIGEFSKALQKGVSVDEAAYRSRDLMDFARSGTNTKEINKVVAFLNASIQGKSKFIRTMKEDPIGVSGRLFTTMALPSIGIYALNNQLANDEQKAAIKDAPNWLKDSFWLVAVPNTNTVARIPKPFEGAMVSSGVERFLDYALENNKEAFDNIVGEIAKQQALPTMLTGIQPIIEGMANYSFFRETPLIPKREQFLQPQDQYDIYTSEISKGLAGALQKIPGLKDTNFASPRVMENTIKGFTAGLGDYALQAGDIPFGKNKPSKNTSQLPVVKGFTVNENSTGKAVEFIYNEVDRLAKEKGSAKANNATFDKIPAYKNVSKLADRVSEISKEIRDIQNSKTLSSDDKRDKINKLSQLRNQIARQGMENYKKVYP
jgi:hypothetical protein